MAARRAALGLSQSALAERAGTTRHNISSIESGKRPCGREMQHRIRRALVEYPSIVLDRNRQQVMQIADRYAVRHVRVFGSVARGSERPDSDIDLLVELPESGRVRAHVGFRDDVQRLLATRVDVMADRSDPSESDRALRQARIEAVPL